MSLATAILPTNPDELRAFAQALHSELYAKTLHIEKPKAQPKRARFGQSCEKLDRQIDLLELIIGEPEEGEPRAKRAPPRRRPATGQTGAHRQPPAAACSPAARDRHPCVSLRLSGLRLGAAAQERRR